MDYHIARDGQQLGVFSESQIREKLINGTYQPTDSAWCEGMADWKPLSELFSGIVGGATPPPVPQQPTVPDQFVSAPKPSGLSIASLTCGILSFFTCGVTGLPGIICGHMALSRIKKSLGAIGGKGMAIAGLVTSYIGFSIIGIFVVAPMILIGTQAYKRGADRSKCIMQMASVQKAVRTHQNIIEGVEGGPLIHTTTLMGPGLYFENVLTCPDSTGVYTYLTIFPAVGTPYVSCSLCAAPTLHVPSSTIGW